MNCLPTYSTTIYSCKKYSSMYSFENIFFPSKKIMIYEVGYLLTYFTPYFIHSQQSVVGIFETLKYVNDNFSVLKQAQLTVGPTKSK